jgi:hypothetical protein
MGYNASEIITRFVKNAGSWHHYERGPSGRLRQRFPDGRSSSLLYRKDGKGRVIEIQSYGSHFPLATLLLHPSGRRKMWLLNGDRWPGGGFGRTNEHNDIARAAAQASGTPWFIVPFSALRAAGIDPESIRPVHVEPESWTTEDHSAATLDEVPERHRKRHMWADEDGRIIEAPRTEDGRETWPDRAHGGWSRQVRRLGDNGFAWYHDSVDGPEYTGELTPHYAELEPGADGLYHWTTERHWLGSSLFRARYYESHFTGRGKSRHQVSGNRWAYFVTSFDYNEPRPLWFMSELARGVKPATVAEAIDALKPDDVRYAESIGIPVLRQGDVFVIQSPGTTERGLLAQGGELVPVTREYGKATARYVNDSHTATRAIAMPDGTLYVRGIMRHRPDWRRPDHVALELWDRETWGRVVLNAQARSIDASPRSWSMGGDVD